MLRQYFTLFFFVFLISNSSFAQEWTCLGPFSPTIPTVEEGQMTPHGIGRLHSIALLNRKGTKILASSSTGGLFITHNKGETWTPNLNYNPIVGINKIIAFNKRRYWVATCNNHMSYKHYGFGILETKNKGKTWDTIGFNQLPSEYEECCLYDLAICPKSKKTAYTISESKVWKTTDRGKNWVLVFDNKSANLRNIYTSKHNPQKIIIAGEKAFVSMDAGMNWNEMTDSITQHIPSKKSGRISFHYSGKKDERLYCAVLDRKAYFLISDDAGKTWRLTNSDAAYCDFNKFTIWTFEHNKTEHILIGGIRAFMSVDTGKTFKQVTFPLLSPNYVHDDIRDFAINKRGEIYLAHDGGLALSKDQCQTYTDITGTGMNITQFYGMSNSEKHPYYFLAGTLDMSTKIYDNGKWYCIPVYSDGGRARTHPDDSLLAHVSVSGYCYRFDSISSQWRYAHPFGKRGGFDFAMEYNHDGKWIYMASDHVWRMKTGEKTWEHLTGGLPTHRDVTTIAISPFDPDKIWFARLEPTWSASDLKEKLYYTPDAGKTWVDKTPNMPILAWRFIKHLMIHPENDSILFAGLGNFDSNKEGTVPMKVFVSKDLGETWENISDGLPNYPVNYLNYYRGYIFAATDVGVYYKKENTDDQWAVYGEKLPPTIVSEIHVNRAANKLRAATFGRGIWEVDLPSVSE
jgi:xyloglucan-specific exo-beta-1,4-glucanase